MNSRSSPAVPGERKSSCQRNCLCLGILEPTAQAAKGPPRKRKLEPNLMALRATYREAAGVTVVDIGGRITLGEGSALLRNTIREVLAHQRTLILLNLADVHY